MHETGFGGIQYTHVHVSKDWPCTMYFLLWSEAKKKKKFGVSDLESVQSRARGMSALQDEWSCSAYRRESPRRADGCL